MESVVTTAAEQAVIRKVWLRIVPLSVLILFTNNLDRINISYAAITMNHDLGLSNTTFGLAVGFYSIGFLLFGLPSTFLLHRLGAKRWITAMMVGWGLATAATAFIGRGEHLMGARLLVGAAEAGFSPGVILYFGYWFPKNYRGRALSTFLFISPVALIIGGPASSLLLSLNGVLGLAGWRWIFLAEAAPTLLLALAAFRLLTDRPRDARWLSPPQKDWLEAKLASESQDELGERSSGSAWQAVADWRVWLLAAVYLAISTSGQGLIFFLPLMIRSMHVSVAMTGVVAAAPAVVAALGLPLWGSWADRARHRETVAAVACGMVAAGLLVSAVLLPTPWALAGMALALTGFYGCLAAFWTLPSSFLTGAGAAIGLAVISTTGNCASFTGPLILGRALDLTHSHRAGLCALAAAAAVAAGLLIVKRLSGRRAQDGRVMASAEAAAPQAR
jgi:ACS family tartrate transporter-like MFS transporter